MKQKHVDYKMVSYSKARRFMAAARRSVQRTPRMHGLIEVDVTRARTFLREHKAKTGEALSFTAFIIACVAKAVDEHKDVQAYRKGRKRLMLFEDVDVMTYIERDVAGQKEIMPYIIRAANRKTVPRDSSRDQSSQGGGYGKSRGGSQTGSVPADLSLQILPVDGRQVSTDGKEVQGDGGTLIDWHVWERAQLGHPSSRSHHSIIVGGIGEKPGVVDGHIAIREYLSMTISFDHDMIDGAPAARFTQRLKELIESGYGLFDSTVEPEQIPLTREVHYVYNS